MHHSLTLRRRWRPMPPPVTWSLLVLVPALAWSCGPGADAPDSGRPSELPERAVVDPGWDTLFKVGGTPEDTLLLLPGRLAADEDGVIVSDVYGARVLRFDRRGEMLWMFGARGSGPDEFRAIRDLHLDANGRVWVLDTENARVMILNRHGVPERRIPLTDVGVPADDIAPLPDGDMILITEDAERPLVRVGPDGVVLSREPFPWPGFAGLHPMTRQVITASDPRSGRWVSAFQVGDGFFRFVGSEPRGGRGWFVEEVLFPGVLQERTGLTTTTRLSSPTFAAWSIALTEERLYVLFAGRSTHRMRVLDTYSLEDGRYLESFRLPRSLTAIALAGGTLYGVFSDPWPTLIALQPREAKLP